MKIQLGELYVLQNVLLDFLSNFENMNWTYFTKTLFYL